MPPGTLDVTVLGARDLRNAQTIGRQDPFFLIRVGSKHFTSSVAKDGGRNPVWNARFSFEVTNEEKVYFTIRSRNVVSADALLGDAEINLSQVYAEGKHDATVYVVASTGQIQGSLSCILLFRPHASTGGGKTKGHKQPMDMYQSQQMGGYASPHSGGPYQPTQGGYSNQGYQQPAPQYGGFNPNQPSAPPAYAPQQGGGYSQPAGYFQQPSGYPSAPMGFPQSTPQSGYPPQSPVGFTQQSPGYQPSQPTGYLQPPSMGYAPQGQPTGYSQQQPMGYSQPSPGFPSQTPTDYGDSKQTNLRPHYPPLMSPQSGYSQSPSGYPSHQTPNTLQRPEGIYSYPPSSNISSSPGVPPAGYPTKHSGNKPGSGYGSTVLVPAPGIYYTSHHHGGKKKHKKKHLKKFKKFKRYFHR